MEFSKKLLYIDYVVLAILIVCAVKFPEIDFPTIIVAWIAQLGLSSGAYYWKARNENKIKVPVKVIKSLPKSMRDNVDLTQVITAIIQSE